MYNSTCKPVLLKTTLRSSTDTINSSPLTCESSIHKYLRIVLNCAEPRTVTRLHMIHDYRRSSLMINELQRQRARKRERERERERVREREKDRQTDRRAETEISAVDVGYRGRRVRKSCRREFALDTRIRTCTHIYARARVVIRRKTIDAPSDFRAVLACEGLLCSGREIGDTSFRHRARASLE